MIFCGQQGEELKENASKLGTGLKNPYFNLYHWIKGEIFDIESLAKALTFKEKCQQMVLQKEKTKKNTQETLDDVTTGKKSIKTVFKSIDDTGKMVNKIEAVSLFIFSH
jgi:hypothetical protein